MRRVAPWFLLLSCFLPSRSSSQLDTARVVRDSTIAIPPPLDTLRSGNDTSRSTIGDTVFYKPTKKPWLAVGLSAAIPGLGQIYNGDYWKTPIIIGLGGYWISEWVKLNGKYNDFRDRYLQSITPSLPSGNGQYRQNRDFYRDERDKFAWYLGALYFLNLVDAYVGASLYDFDVGSDLGADGRVKPRATATIRVRF